MTDAPGRSKLMAWLAVSLLVLAAVAVALPVTRFALAAGDEGVALGDGPAEVSAPGNRTWGIYVNDADNSGYSTSCALADASGRTVAIRDPGMTVSSSETEMLDHVFTTPADGRFTVDCNVRGASVRVGPVGSTTEVVIGLTLGGLLGIGGVVAASIWLARRPWGATAATA